MVKQPTGAKARRNFIKANVIAWFSDHFHMPTSSFPEDTDLRDQLLFTTESIVEFGKYINRSNWTPVMLYPKQYAACETIGDIIDLIFDYSE